MLDPLVSWYKPLALTVLPVLPVLPVFFPSGVLSAGEGGMKER